MKALVELIDRYRPGFARETRPAAPEVIEDLTGFAGALPGAYLRFLKTMGGNMVGFLPAGADFNVEERVLNFQLEPELRQTPLFLIASGGVLDPGGDLFMDRRQPYGNDDCLVVVVPPGPDVRIDRAAPFHAGLEELLYVEAYRQFRLRALSSQAEMILATGTPPSAAHFDGVMATASHLGFSTIPPARRSALLERGDAAAVVYRPPHIERLSLRLGASDDDELRRLSDVFMKQLPLRRLT